MRPAVAMLAIFATGALSFAVADPPADPPAAANPTPAPSPSEAQPSQEAPDKTAAPHAAETSAVAPAKAAASDSDERMQERLLRDQGYKLAMVRGQPKYCRRETPIGSHLASVMHCVTVAEAEMMAKEGRETTERIQRNVSGCLTPSAGGCGH